MPMGLLIRSPLMFGLICEIGSLEGPLVMVGVVIGVSKGDGGLT